MRSLFVTLVLGVMFTTPAFAQMTKGKVLIKLEAQAKTDAEAQAALEQLSCAKDIGLVLERRSVLNWVVADVSAETEEDTNKALEWLREEKAVLAVDTVRMKQAFRVPNDELVGELWGFAGIGADITWDTTIGLSTQRIGVVDSGINRDHIDLIAKDQAGFDFISVASIAQDGNGRDPDYSDDSPSNGFHGSHVSGTIAASADDFIGVPGLNWNAQLVTARAIGNGGGLNSDIVEAAAWMAGAEIPGVPNIGADRVSVINLSLGADEPCSAFEEEVFSAIIASGVTVVAAAGNTSNFTPTGSPANCPGVIAVAAAGPTFRLASYSNFDDRIDVVAPGGDGFSGDPAESILSVDGSDDFSYVAIDGTSMATPHVAGVVSLMQAVNPQLSPAQIRDILASSPFTCAGFTCDDKTFLDAPDAVARALATDGELDEQAPAPPGGGSCPPNASLTSDGQFCACNQGFVVNATEDGCIPESNNGGGGGGGGNDNGGCGPNSTPTDDGQFCICDPGFDVNEAETACVPEDEGAGDEDDDEDNEDEDDDSDEDSDDDARSSSFSGCTASGTPASIVALAALLALMRRRSRHLAAKPALVPAARASLVVGCVLSVGCAHAVRIESTPGAEIFVDGQRVGTSPATYNETTGGAATVRVTAKKSGRENTVMVQKNQVDWGAVGAGTAAGVGACCAISAVAGAAALVFYPCAALGLVGWGAAAAGPLGGWLWFGNKMPDVVRVDLNEVAPAAAVAQSPPSTADERQGF